MVAQTAPAVRVAIGEEAGLAPGSVSTGQMVAGLKRLGFDYVFDTGAYLTENIVCCIQNMSRRH
jgi:NADH-quinone oxidoreductase subunit G